jgi:hypothetical protein
LGPEVNPVSSFVGCRVAAASPFPLTPAQWAVRWTGFLRAGSLPAVAKGRILMGTFKKTAKWTVIVVTGLVGIVLLGGGKIQSGSLLIFAAFALAVPKRHRLPLWVRIGLLCALYGMVAWNISTTEIPDPSDGLRVSCGTEVADWDAPTGITLLDKAFYIFSTFAAQAAPS